MNSVSGDVDKTGTLDLCLKAKNNSDKGTPVVINGRGQQITSWTPSALAKENAMDICSPSTTQPVICSFDQKFIPKPQLQLWKP